MKRFRENGLKKGVPRIYVRANRFMRFIGISPYFPKKKPGACASRHSFDLVIPEGLEPATR